MVYDRGTSVICRTRRGLEIGSVLNISEPSEESTFGTILRQASAEDHLLWARIERNRSSAFEDCQRLLDERNAQTALIDVELLFDGESIFFYFLGDITPAIEQLTQELAATYEAKVQLKQFAEAMATGCGPGCGTDEAAGCGDSGGCSTCSIASACGAKS
jgi:cell fate regulator YaaT (PSP1 superfamily)